MKMLNLGLAKGLKRLHYPLEVILTCGGSKGSINAHRSSSMIGVPISLVPVV
jgi:hypothetical protein